MDYKLLALTIGPGLAIAIFVYWRDKFHREPLLMFIKAFFMGCFSVVPAIVLEKLGGYSGIKPSLNMFETASYAYLVVALAEEGSKFFFLRKYIFNSSAFDEPYDGITYSVMISMGFATLENILYVFGSTANYEVALLRMFTAVPAHATFAIAMGYYVGMAKFKIQKQFFYLLAGLLAAMILHGTYDFFLMQRNYPEIVGGAFVSLGLSVIYSFRAIHLHRKRSVA